MTASAAKEFSKDAEPIPVEVGHITDDIMCLDIGPKTIEIYVKEIEKSKNRYLERAYGRV